ncbi:2'-5' RNA ligase [Pseudacidovorax sp. 1753]|uniref:2'-5' RNA ligase family protein n=1 Tax=Pseudacidovorax sp. 1753 TaxID=3156419 RepID=UPI00339B890D
MTDLRPPVLYVFLMPGPAVQKALDGHRARWCWPKPAKRPKADRLHLTMAVLGPQPDTAIPGIRQALAGVDGSHLHLHLGGARVWTHNGVAVLLAEANPALVDLHARIAQVLRPWAPPPPPWTPHVTLARRAWEAAAPQGDVIDWAVDEFLLVRSWLPPHPVHHEVLARYPLRGGSATPPNL